MKKNWGSDDQMISVGECLAEVRSEAQIDGVESRGEEWRAYVRIRQY